LRNRAGGRFGVRILEGLRITLLLSAFASIGALKWEIGVDYVKSKGLGAMSVSVYHASAWVALKGPWRQACGRVSGREGEGLSGCDPDASIKKRRQ
jgi:hypothetical protein